MVFFQVEGLTGCSQECNVGLEIYKAISIPSTCHQNDEYDDDEDEMATQY